MKQFLLKTWLTMLCLLVGVGTMWAEEQTATFTMKNSGQSSPVTVNGVTFTWTSSDIVVGTNNGSGFKANSNMTITIPAGKKLTGIEKGNGNTWGSGAQIDVYAGTSSSGTKITTITKDTHTYTISSNNTGTTYYLANTSTKNAWINTLTIKYDDNGGGSTPTTYTVSLNAGSNGTCSTSSLTEASVGAGVTLPSCTANTNYTFVGWSTSSSPTSADAGEAGANYKPSSNCTLYAYYTYQAPSHDAKFFVNGQQYGETQSVAEGSAITFPANKPADIDDKKFVGWAEATISGTTDTAPTFVTNATMGTNDKYFYAVYATANGGGETLLETVGFESSEGYTATTTYNSSNYTTGSTGSKWKINYGAFSTNNAIIGSQSAQFRIYNSGGGYGQLMNTVAYSSNITKVEYSAKAANTNGQVKVSCSTNGTSWTDITTQSLTTTTTEYSASVPVSGVRYIKFTAAGTKPSSNSYSIYVDGVKITAGTGTTYSDYCTTVSTKTLSSISVKTAPSKVTYTEEEMFDPAGLVITATYDDESTEDIAYAGNESKFTFSPSLTTALAPSNTEVQITYNEKTCTQTITVNAIPTYTLTITQPTGGGTLTVKNGETLLENGASVRVGTSLTCEVTDIPAGKRFSRFYAKWGEEDGQSKYKGTNPATFDNIATENITACEIYVTYKDIEYYTINYIINGVNTNPQENLEENTALTFPTAPSSINGKVFRGWVEEAIDGSTDDAPTFVNVQDLKATQNATYYAVYATQEGNATETWNKVTDASTLTAGDEITFVSSEAVDYNSPGTTTKVNGYVAISTQNTNNWKGVGVTVANDELTTLDNVQTFTLTATSSDDYPWAFCYDNKYIFAAGGTSDNYLKSSEELSDAASFSINIEDGAATIVANVSDDGDKKARNVLQINGSYNSGAKTANPVFSCYSSSSTQKKPSIYKKIGGATYSDYCTTVGTPVINLDENSASTEGIVEEGVDVHVARSLKADIWNTLCLPFDMDEEQIETNFGAEAEVKKFSGLTISGDNYSLQFSDASTIQAGTAYMVRVKNPVTEINVSGVDVVMDDDTYNCDSQTASDDDEKEVTVTFQGNYYTQDVPMDSYIISSNKFYLVNSTVINKGFRGYFTVEVGGASSNKALNLSFSFDDVTTGIEGVTVEGLNDDIFNLQGQRINRIQQGVNIINGRKVVR